MLHDKIGTRKDKSTERFTQTLAISCMSLTSFTFTSVPWRITIFYISFLRVDWALNIVHYFNMNFFYFFKYICCRLVYLSAVVALWDQGSVERSVPAGTLFDTLSWYTQFAVTLEGANTLFSGRHLLLSGAGRQLSVHELPQFSHAGFSLHINIRPLSC